ncbi:MAG: succinylglutamate desuccinylase/aspartoacylase family protein [Gemmatimonadota bacterium]|nr:succinylglutamate desuccinylase/aspartoacylase family protein [Gemmatimonadota bacterium]
MARRTTGEWAFLPVEVVHGSREGPAVWLSGAIHGDELDGVEIIRQVLGRLRAPSMAGTVLAVPVVNVFGFSNENRYLPDRRDLNRSFPGGARGSMASRLAHLFMKEVVSLCDVGLDFHCGSDGRENHPQVRCNLDDPETREYARAFAAPITIHNRPPDGSLRKAALKEGARVLVYEAGEVGRFTPSAIETGVAGTLRLLRSLGMVGGDAVDEPSTLEVRETYWIRANRSGVFRVSVALGEHVEKGQHLGSIADTLGDEGRPVRARTAGMVIGRRVNPLVYQGEAVVHVASLDGSPLE